MVTPVSSIVSESVLNKNIEKNQEKGQKLFSTLIKVSQKNTFKPLYKKIAPVLSKKLNTPYTEVYCGGSLYSFFIPKIQRFYSILFGGIANHSRGSKNLYPLNNHNRLQIIFQDLIFIKRNQLYDEYFSTT